MVEDVIDRLLDVRNGRPGKPVQLTENEIRQLCIMAKDVFLAQPNLLELEAPIKICGEFSVPFFFGRQGDRVMRRYWTTCLNILQK